ncbi:MAG TPA: ATP-binding protein [Streptosporangiaceae bacterium]|nr:ATP-binding protein [Streptosporangiaceae bacterium]
MTHGITGSGAGGKADRRIFGIGELGRRLALAFVLVALMAIVVLAGVGMTSTNSAMTRLGRQQGEVLTSSVAAGAGAAYDHGGWKRANLGPILDVAATAEAGAQVRDMTGTVMGSSPGFTTLPPGAVLGEPVVVRGRQVGWVTVRFGSSGLGAAMQNFEASRWRIRLFASAIAALLALLVSLVISRRITAPLEVMLEVIRARAAGDRGARIKKVRGVGVERELQEAFNQSAEAVDRRDRLQRNLVADVAHEVRTPVAILQAGHEAMLDGVTELTSENVASLHDEVLRLARKVDDLQRLAAAESAALQLRRSPHDLAAIASQAAGSLGEAFSAAGVGLSQRLAEAPVLCDTDRMREVVTNLLTNALKYTPPGGRVVLETEPDGRHLAALRVSDTGKGIAAEELPHVTERFFRSTSAAGKAAGTGIGLTIVAELVRAHHGELEIASEEGKGTQVTVMLPLADDAGS